MSAPLGRLHLPWVDLPLFGLLLACAPVCTLPDLPEQVGLGPGGASLLERAALPPVLGLAQVQLRPMRRSWYSISLSAWTVGESCSSSSTYRLPSNSFTASMMVKGYRLVPFPRGGADHRGFLFVHHEMHLDGALRAAAFAASFTHYSFSSSIGLRHSGCCFSAVGRGRLRARFMYMNRLACLPSI